MSSIKWNLKQYFLIITIVFPIIFNYIVLNRQIETFVSTSAVQSIIIQLFGQLYRVDAINVEISLPNWIWQEHTVSYTSNALVAPSITIFTLSAVSGIDILSVTYLPISYILSALFFYLIANEMVKDKRLSISLQMLLFVIPWLRFVSERVIGVFYALDYHAYSMSLAIAIIYVLVKYFNRGFDLKNSIILFTLFYTIISITHYRSPYMILGGLLAILAFEVLVKTMKSRYESKSFQFYPLILIALIMLFLNSFYVAFVGGSIDIGNFINNLLRYLSTFYKEPIYTSKEELLYLFYTRINWYSVTTGKIFTYSSLIYITVCVILLLFTKSHATLQELGSYCRFFIYVLGASVARFLAYFAILGYGNFNPEYSWLLVLLILLSYKAFLNANMRHVLKKILIPFTTALIIAIVVSSALIALITIITMGMEYNPRTPPPYEALFASDYIIKYSSKKFIYRLAASHSTASTIYMNIASSSFDHLQRIIVGNLYASININNVCDVIKNSYNLVLLSENDIEKGIYSDLGLINYIDPASVKSLINCLLIEKNTDIVLNSNRVLLFFSSS